MSNDDQERELLEYQTETIDEDLAAAAVPVVVAEPVVTVPTVAQHVDTYTVVVDTDVAKFAELLPLDPLRLSAQIIASDAAIVLCHSRAQATDTRNQVANVPNPVGAYIPTGVVVDVPGTQQMFAAATSATAARVTVIVARRSP